MLREESRQVAGVFENIFGDQFLQLGAWGESALFRRHARTRRYAIVASAMGSGVDVVSRLEDLAVAPDSVDGIFLPHLLETTPDPHAVLREVERILRPDGCLVVAGFNPWGWWGVRHYLSRGFFPGDGRRMVAEHRLRDWLKLLDYQVDPAQFYHLSAPVYRALPSAETPLEPDAATPPSPKGWHPLASAYLLVARKTSWTVTPLRGPFRRRSQPRLGTGLVQPTSRHVA